MLGRHLLCIELLTRNGVTDGNCTRSDSFTGSDATITTRSPLEPLGGLAPPFRIYEIRASLSMRKGLEMRWCGQQVTLLRLGSVSAARFFFTMPAL